MKTHPMSFRNRKTGTVWTGVIPVFDSTFARHIDDMTGFCISCGSTQGNCEPDARGYRCENCNLPKVYGIEEFLMRGWIHEEREVEA